MFPHMEASNKKTLHDAYLSICDTPLGPISIMWIQRENKTKVIRFVLPKREDSNCLINVPVRQKKLPADLVSLCRLLDMYFQGKDVNFPHHILHYDLCSPFQRQVLKACASIPRGKVVTYGMVAKHLGEIRLSRAIGQALTKNPFPIVIPCHRVVYSNGHIGGFSAGKDMKEWLLEREGILISKGEINLENYLFEL